MEKIASFTVDHTRLERGIFVSRQDRFGETVLTTFDIRLKRPNREPVLDNPALHTIEHLGATFLRNHPVWGPKTVYFGPMGCRTGFYVIFEGALTSREILPLIRNLFNWIAEFNGPLPGASAEECGNYLDHNVGMARWEARRFLEVLNNPLPENLEYPASNK
ncbi:S-ribosylhomocysteine lyase [Treponema sp. J25]|uniref:S-ribosylhomocysteine lyase n=1 Tax=Treponema sp. J25 TaxID=2094121 RepID=UPI001052A722|nr:S-ribosylhomocysteine lyase [Treponema sp. J25]TCW60942.1 S-ribosylhomocysteine lyase [Treponema sp. J25]